MNEAGLSHSRWDCTYHIVRLPKYRRKVLCHRTGPRWALWSGGFSKGRGARWWGQRARRPRARLRGDAAEAGGARRDGAREGQGCHSAAATGTRNGAGSSGRIKPFGPGATARAPSGRAGRPSGAVSPSRRTAAGSSRERRERAPFGGAPADCRGHRGFGRNR